MFSTLVRRLGVSTLAVIVLAGFCSIAAAQKPSDLDRILEDGRIRIGAPLSDPWYIQAPGSNEWTGLAVDVMKLIFESIDVEVEFVPTQWGTAVAGLQAGRFDLVGAFDPTPERALAVAFTDPLGYINTGIVTFAKDWEKYRSWEDLNQPDVRVAAVDGNATTIAVQPILTDVEWILVPKYENAFLEMQSGRADVVIGSDVSLGKFIRQHNKGTMVIPEPVLNTPTSIALRKSDPADLRDWLNQVLGYFQRNGEIDQIWQNYAPSKR